jgi:hypothetical protein
MVNDYLIGNMVRLSAVFKDAADVAADPTTVSLVIKLRDGASETVTPTKDSVGNYHHDYTPASEGAYFYRFAGTGAVTAATEGSFTVSESSVI